MITLLTGKTTADIATLDYDIINGLYVGNLYDINDHKIGTFTTESLDELTEENEH